MLAYRTTTASGVTVERLHLATGRVPNGTGPERDLNATSTKELCCGTCADFEGCTAAAVHADKVGKTGPSCYGTRSPLKNIRTRGRIIFLFFPRAARARAENKANQQCHFKSSRWCMELLDTSTDSCRGTVPMEPPMPTCNFSMHHREPKSKIDDTGQFLQGASCTIAATRMIQEAPCTIIRVS